MTSLTLADVMDMVPDASGISGTNIDSSDHVLKITGNTDDNVNLKSVLNSNNEGTWSSSSTETIDNVTYDVYTNDENSSYKVLVQQDINDTIS